MIIFGTKQVTICKMYDHINDLYMICMFSNADAVADEDSVLTVDQYNNSMKLYFTTRKQRNKVFKTLRAKDED